MSGRKLAVLSAAAAALVAYIWFYERHRPSTDEAREKGKLVLDLDGEKITRLSVRRGFSAVVLEKKDGSWRLVEPLAGRADSGAVQGLLGTLARLESQRALDPPPPLAELGLAPPRAVVVAEAGAERHEIAIGSDVPASPSVTVRRARDGAVFVVARQIALDVEREVDAWRDLQVVDVLAGDVTGLTLERDGERVEVRRHGALWRIAAPLADAAAGDAIQDILDSMTALRADRFLPAGSDAAALGLASPAMRVTLALAKGKEPLVVDFGGALEDDPNLVAARHGDVFFAVSGGVLERLRTPLTDLREGRLVALENWEIKRLRVSLGGRDVTLEQRSGQWYAGTVKLADAEEREVIAALESARATGFLRPSEVLALGLSREPAGTVSVEQENAGTRELAIHTLAKDPLKVAIVEKGRPDPMVTASAFLERLQVALAAVPTAAKPAPAR